MRRLRKPRNPKGEGAMPLRESERRRALRADAAELGSRFGYDYFVEQARAGGHLDELWLEAGKLGYLAVHIPQAYGGDGGGIADLSVVLEELAAAGCPLEMMVMSSGLCASMIIGLGSEEQKQRWLPGMADGSLIVCIAMTEPDAGFNVHNITTMARRDGNEWVLRGRKRFVSGVEVADALLVLSQVEDAHTGAVRPALFVVPTDAAGLTRQPMDMELVFAHRQFELSFDGVRLPADARLGTEATKLADLFVGFNPERVMTSAWAIGCARHALDKAVAYVSQRRVWGTPLGAHQGLAHPLAQCKIELELARLMTQQAGELCDAGDDLAAEASNMAKFAAAEAFVHAVDQAVQSMGGIGLSHAGGVASLLTVARLARIAPVSREMILNYVAHKTLGLPKSY
jgi:alkylation response protein AidB-like acyl-CoA dehydrogenase